MLEILIALGALIIGGSTFNHIHSARPHEGKLSDHFDGKRFFNPSMPTRTETRGRRSVLGWMLSRRRGLWQHHDVVPTKPPQRVSEGLRVTFINHATVLLQFSGLNIITDPVWSRRASPFSFAGPERWADPGVRFEDLPPIDIVLLSHNHYDHMDIATLRRIAAAWNPRIYTGLGNAAYLARQGIKGAHDLDWWDTAESAGITINAVPAQHFSARTMSDRNITLWCGFVLETPRGRIYFSGDTGCGPFVQEIARRFGGMHLALIPIGAYEPAWMMRPVHTDPDEALRMHDELRADVSLGIHHGTFRLTDEPQREPRERIKRGRGAREFRVEDNGGSFTL